MRKLWRYRFWNLEKRVMELEKEAAFYKERHRTYLSSIEALSRRLDRMEEPKSLLTGVDWDEINDGILGTSGVAYSPVPHESPAHYWDGRSYKLKRPVPDPPFLTGIDWGLAGEPISLAYDRISERMSNLQQQNRLREAIFRTMPTPTLDDLFPRRAEGDYTVGDLWRDLGRLPDYKNPSYYWDGRRYSPRLARPR